MDQDPQQYMEVASKGLDVAHKSGLLKSIISWLPSHDRKQSVQLVDYRKEAEIALQENAVETLAGLTLTAAGAVQILEPGFTLEGLDKVNSTWQRHWTGCASKGGRLLLTDIGRQIYRLVTPSYVQSYRDEIVKEWQKSYTVNRVIL